MQRSSAKSPKKSQLGESFDYGSQLSKSSIVEKSITKKPEKKGWSIFDLNNIEGADRKLSVNGVMEIWVHDEVLSLNSDFFRELLEGQETSKPEATSYVKTEISIPFSDNFYDVLTWIYSKDKKRLKKAAIETEAFLKLLSLGSFLKMHEDFFEALIEDSTIDLCIKDFEADSWSRKAFSFPVLTKLVESLKLPKQETLIALFTWMKEDFVNYPYTTIECAREREIEMVTSLEYYLLRNYIKSNQLMKGIDTLFLKELYTEFPKLTGLFDTEQVFREFGLLSERKCWCKICKTVFNSPLDAARNPQCEKRLFHPRSFVTSFRGLGDKSYSCLHGTCTKKPQRNEYPCCHQPAHCEGCTMGEGTHFLVIE